MNNSILRTTTFVIILASLLSACSLPASTPTVDQGAIYTQAAQTVQAQLTQGAPPTEAPPPVSPDFTATSEVVTAPTQAPPTEQPTPTATPEPTEPTTPPETPTRAPCEDKVEFVDDVTIPDDTAILPGESFIKTWRLRNVGTCTWTTAYALVFVDGEQMGGAASTNLAGEVPAEGTIDISVELKAPGVPGTYKGNWMLSNIGGTKFGLGKEADRPFWVQIIVEEGTQGLNLGNPTWRDNLDNASYWYLLDTEDTKFEVKDGHMVMTSFSPGGGEEWGLSNRGELKDFYMEITAKTGETCSGLDRYGLLVRAPDPNEGYVFGFSCDGRYRLYEWDGENYAAIQEWKSSGLINAGADQTNRLGIWLQGETIRLYANGKLLAEFSDDTYDEGRFGLFIGAAETEDFTVFVEEVAYWDLED